MRCQTGQEPEMAMKRGEEAAALAAGEEEGSGAVSAACLSKATPFAVSHFFAMAQTIFYGQACQICRMRQRQV